MDSVRPPDSLDWQKFYGRALAVRGNEAGSTLNKSLDFACSMTPNMTARVGFASVIFLAPRRFQKKIWFHILLAGVCCGCVRLSESAAVESSLPAQNKPLEARHQRTVFQANHKLDG